MLDIKVIRNDPERVKRAMKTRNADMDAKIDEILAIDGERREFIAEAESKKAQQNAESKQIPAIKKAGGDISEIMAKMKALSDEVTACNAKLSELEEKQRNILLSIPNIPNENVPVGKDDTENVEVRRWGNPTERNCSRIMRNPGRYIRISPTRMLSICIGTKKEGGSVAGLC